MTNEIDKALIQQNNRQFAKEVRLQIAIDELLSIEHDLFCVRDCISHKDEEGQTRWDEEVRTIARCLAMLELRKLGDEGGLDMAKEHESAKFQRYSHSPQSDLACDRLEELRKNDRDQ